MGSLCSCLRGEKGSIGLERIVPFEKLKKEEQKKDYEAVKVLLEALPIC